MYIIDTRIENSRPSTQPVSQLMTLHCYRPKSKHSDIKSYPQYDSAFITAIKLKIPELMSAIKTLRHSFNPGPGENIDIYLKALTKVKHNEQDRKFCHDQDLKSVLWNTW